MLTSSKTLTIGVIFFLILVTASYVAVGVFPEWYKRNYAVIEEKITDTAENTFNSKPVEQTEKDFDGIQPGEVVIEYKIPILMYHYVEYNPNKDDFLRDSINTEPDVFENQIITLKDAGYEFITPEQLVSIVKSGKIDTNKYVIISFDDGYRDFYTDVFPILLRHEAKAVVYVVAQFVNQPNYMYDSQLREIAKSGLVEIGSHTLNHLDLKGMDAAAVKSDLTESKRIIEEKFLVKATSFAYPYGGFDQNTPGLVQESGYTSAVTVINGNKAHEKNLFVLPRIRPGKNIGTALINRIETID